MTQAMNYIENVTVIFNDNALNGTISSLFT